MLLPDLVVSYQNGLVVGFGNLPGLLHAYFTSLPL